MPYRLIIYIVYPLLFAIACSNTLASKKNNETSPSQEPIAQTPNTFNYKVVAIYPHVANSFTEGLLYVNHYFYESAGGYGDSRIMKVIPQTAQIVKSININKNYFGEGIAIFNNRLYQLTYREQKIFVYDTENFKLIKSFDWQNGEGWGMTVNKQYLIVSNGSSNLYFLDPQTCTVQHIVSVHDNLGLVNNINSLQWIDGKIYANIWLTQYIDVINPTTGFVEGQLDCTAILEKNGLSTEGTQEMNGITYDSNNHIIYVTGKYWPAIFGLQLL
ncbi:MAG: glutaminyl-peptide cyclotransferase [Phycisphaerales bacterium]|nr:glutaminyl-peptide cyclotransferase [Phycisphaerales bacterium]